MRNLASPRVIKEILSEYEFRFSKSLGQNFLVDEGALAGILSGADISEDDCVLEIGPGFGTLTQRLCGAAKKVVCVEIDKTVIPILEENLKDFDNFEIINEDVLKVNLNELISKNKNSEIKNAKIVANLPYYITTPIIMKLLEEKLDIETITVMVQKEVADRLIAIPGEKLSGAITYSVYYYATSENVTIVENNSFIPEPEVDSEVIKLSIRKNPPVELLDEDQFFKTVKASFMQRRKTLINALVNGGILKSKQDAKKLFDDLNMNYNTRGESLSIEMFAEISNYIVNNKI